MPAFSSTVTFNPAARIVAAQASPAGPAPMMMASVVEVMAAPFPDAGNGYFAPAASPPDAQ